MILNVDLSSEVPIYQQLRDQIVEAIADGVLTEGSSLPANEVLTTCRSVLDSFGTTQPKDTP